MSPPTILMSDEEDTRIHKHEVALVKVKCMKKEWQRQWEEEAWQVDKAERVWREAEAEKAQRDVEAEEAQKMVEVEEAWKKAREEERFQREAKTVQADAEKKKKVEVLAAWAALAVQSRCTYWFGGG